MEPEWAAVELLECIDSEVNPGRGAELQPQQPQSSQTTLSAIRVLPAPVAGDLFVTCAARGDIGVILFYYEEGGRPMAFRAGASPSVPLALGFASILVQTTSLWPQNTNESFRSPNFRPIW